MSHPTKTRLALLEGGDLAFWRAIPLRMHVGRCEYCQMQMRGFHRTRQVLADAAQDLPPGLDWNRLAEEMTGNIRVGLAAGECVGDYRPRARIWNWRWTNALAAVALTVVFAAGLWLNLPTLERMVHREAPAQTPSLQYAPADSSNVVVSVSAHGSSLARAIDDDTGQTTITEVYDAR